MASKSAKVTGTLASGQPLHPAIESFAQAVAGILVDRYLERKPMKSKARDEASG